MINDSFELKVGIIGNVNVGKSMIANATLGERYTEVSRRRCTSGVNHLRLSTSSDKVAVNDITNNDDRWAMIASNSNDTFREIKADNKALRGTRKIQEKVFDILLKQNLVKMREDTKLVIVEIPGLNEAETEKAYKHYVSDEWDTFDCIILVMDASEGISSDSQVELLRFVKSNLDNKKKLPVIILGNKIDNPSNEDSIDYVREVREQVEKEFQVSDRVSALREVMEASDGATRCSGDIFPIFIPISAKNAFLFRCAMSMSLDQFKKFDDKELIDEIGLYQLGFRTWSRLSEEKQYEEVYEILNDPKEYKTCMESSNFDKFLTVLSYCVGGEDVQLALIEKQLEVEINSLSVDSFDVAQLFPMYEKIKALGQSVDRLMIGFWKIYSESMIKALSSFESDVMNVEHLRAPARLLADFSKYIQDMAKKDGESSVTRKMHDLILLEAKGLFRRQVGVLIEKANVWDCEKCSTDKNVVTWDNLSQYDWGSIISFVLLVSNHPCFCEHFSYEKILLENYLQRFKMHYSRCCSTDEKEGVRVHGNRPDCFFEMSKFVLRDGKFQPLSDSYHSHYRIKFTESYSDPSHWGHIAWVCCQTISSVKSFDKPSDQER